MQLKTSPRVLPVVILIAWLWIAPGKPHNNMLQACDTHCAMNQAMPHTSAHSCHLQKSRQCAVTQMMTFAASTTSKATVFVANTALTCTPAQNARGIILSETAPSRPANPL